METKKIRKILVVDNNPVILRLMSHMLEEMGYEVATAVDGLNALKTLDNFIPEVIFIDLVMPKIGGEKLCRIIRGLPKMKNVFLVIFSGIAAEEQIDFRKIGADACIAKGPFSEIREHVKKVLAMAANRLTSPISRKIFGPESFFEREITKELLYTKKHFEIALNRISDAFLELTHEGKIVYANIAASKMLGQPEEKVLSQCFDHFFPENQQPYIRDLLVQLDDELITVGEEKSLFIKDRQILLNMVAVNDLSQSFIIAVIHDITERKQNESNMVKQQEELERLVAERTLDLLEANTKLQRDIIERKKLYDQREELIHELENALAKVKTLSGFLPICSSCKKIRDDKGYWQQLEAYLAKHSGAEFSHSICPECSQKLYPELEDEE